MLGNVQSLTSPSSLRIRVKAELSDSNHKEGEEPTLAETSTPPTTPPSEQGTTDQSAATIQTGTPDSGGQQGDAESTAVQPSSASVKSGKNRLRKRNRNGGSDSEREVLRRVWERNRPSRKGEWRRRRWVRGVERVPVGGGEL